MYECPGLAPVSAVAGRGAYQFLGGSPPRCPPLPWTSLVPTPQTGEMEVRNPLFDHASLPAPPPQ